jgi:hypothetical protein
MAAAAARLVGGGAARRIVLAVLGERREKREHVLRDGIHWSAAGNRAVADTLGAFLASIPRAGRTAAR